MTIFRLVRTHEFNQSNLRFLVKNTLLNNSHLERFIFVEACIAKFEKTFCTLFPMECHKLLFITNAIDFNRIFRLPTPE